MKIDALTGFPIIDLDPKTIAFNVLLDEMRMLNVKILRFEEGLDVVHGEFLEFIRKYPEFRRKMRSKARQRSLKDRGLESK